jgi:hypothetical protein
VSISVIRGSTCCTVPSSRPSCLLPTMVVATIAYRGPPALRGSEGPAGPKQYGSGLHGQYECWVTMPHPKAETMVKQRLKSPGGSTRDQFCDLIAVAHADCSTDVLETANLLEPHASGKPTLIRFDSLTSAQGSAHKVSWQAREHSRAPNVVRFLHPTSLAAGCVIWFRPPPLLRMERSVGRHISRRHRPKLSFYAWREPRARVHSDMH